MGKKSVYEALRKAIELNGYPYFAFDDNEATILFSGWDQYQPFDKFLDHIETDGKTKLCIYSELVNGNHEGVAVTVSDDFQHFTYWQSKLWMRERVAAFEQFISNILRLEISLIDFDYESFCVVLDNNNSDAFVIENKMQLMKRMQKYVEYEIDDGEDGLHYIHLEFIGFD